MRDHGWEVSDPISETNLSDVDNLYPDIQPPPAADAETLDTFWLDFVACGEESGIPVEGFLDE